jgi:ferredoxin--NADP+ reductase/benzoate/toluate 1,2-dioxygenase reductase subunit
VFAATKTLKSSMRRVNTASPEQRLPVHRVQSVRPLSGAAFVLRIERNGVDFLPGQYFIINRKGCFAAREYTVYSSTGDDYLEFIISEVNGGAVSPALRKCTPGDALELEGPMGYFHLDDQNNNGTRHYFVATGSGIAPFHSFVGSFADLNYHLLHGVRYAADRYDIQAYAPERYTRCVSREPGGHFQGRVTDYMRRHPVDTSGLFYLCGNCDMLFEAYDILVEKGVPRQNILTEVFY